MKSKFTTSFWYCIWVSEKAKVENGEWFWRRFKGCCLVGGREREIKLLRVV